MSRKSYPRRVKFTRFAPKVGTRLMLNPYINKDKFGRTIRGPVPGTVVYINFPHRYYVAEFDCPGGKFREAFKFYIHADFACTVRDVSEGIGELFPRDTRGSERMVRCTKTGKVYKSIREAARVAGMHESTMSRLCANASKNQNGVCLWEYF